MSFKFLKAEKQFLETGLQTPRSGFFRNPFLLEVISRNHFLLKLNGLKQGLRHRPPFLRYIYSDLSFKNCTIYNLVCAYEEAMLAIGVFTITNFLSQFARSSGD
jgi:hypothetical protein